MDPLIGQVVLGRYQVERRIGAGGMGAVYVGKQTTVGRQVALKILRTDLMTNEHVRERFRREAEIIGKLRHPNTIQLIDYGETDDGLAVMVMELLVGRPLNDALKEKGPLGLADALQVGIEVAQSLAEAHLLGLVHRDLKPANIFLVEVAGQTHAKVLDFGIARILDEEATRLTSTGQVFGTPRYMSPEQALSTGEVDSRSDIYSLGLIIYECIVGQPPFVAQTSIQYLSAHSTQPPPKLRDHYPEGPESLEHLIDACLAKEPSDRPQTAEEVARGLTLILRSLQSGQVIEPLTFSRSTGSGPVASANAGGGTGSTKTVISGTKTEIRPKGNTETSITTGGGPPTAIDDKTLLRPPRPTDAGGGKMSPVAIGALGFFALAAIAGVVAYWRMTKDDVVITGAIVDAGPSIVREAVLDASSAAIVPIVETKPDAGAAIVEAAPDAGEETIVAETKTKTKTKGKGKTKTKDPSIPGIVGTGQGVVTGPATMVMQTGDGDEEAALIAAAKSCKTSNVKGPAKLTLKGCPAGCAIIVAEEKCAGRTPAAAISFPNGFQQVAVVCNGAVRMATQAKFTAEEETELSCR